tara:strand:- start:706 stop:918 length:213 start_codon:yes stop_codon:yes gene_type:complete
MFTINATIRNQLLRGDPLAPDAFDLIAQFALLDVGDPVPDGWRVLDGNMHHSEIVRLVLRHEEEAKETET